MKYLFVLLTLITLNLSGQSKIDQAKRLFEDRKYAESEKLLIPIDDDDRDYAAAQYYLGRIAFAKKEYDDAADYFEEATEADDKVADYFSWLGDTYGTIAGDANVITQGMLAPKMKSAWEKAILLDSKNLGARASLIQYYLQAPGIMGGSIEKAKEVAGQVLNLKPAEGHRQLGNIYMKEKKTGEAEKEFILMVKADPTYVGGLASFYTSQKQYDKAFELFEEAIQKNGNDFLSIYQFGRTSAVSGQRLDKGEEYLKRYLTTYTPKQNEPSHAGANMRLAQIYEKRGNKKEAKRLYELAVKADDNLKEAKEGLERVSK
jgi:tetratricopeptide (TPR) repeat protein